MKIAIISLLLSSMFLLPARSPAQQHSEDYVADEISKNTVALEKWYAFADYCGKNHNQDSQCDGVNWNQGQKLKVMNYDEAVKLGQQMLDEEKARKTKELGPAKAKAEELEKAGRAAQVLAAVRDTLKKACIHRPDADVCRSNEDETVAKIVGTNSDLQTYIDTGILTNTVQILNNTVRVQPAP